MFSRNGMGCTRKAAATSAGDRVVFCRKSEKAIGKDGVWGKRRGVADAKRDGSTEGRRKSKPAPLNPKGAAPDFTFCSFVEALTAVVSETRRGESQKPHP